MARILELKVKTINTKKMKRIIYLSLVMPLFLFSCESTPEASFSTETTEPEVGKEVIFNNDSRNADKFEWDFGDGFISNDENPGHIYTATGAYEVTLKAISKSGLEDKATLILNVMIPTLLEVEVREYYDEYTVSNASIILYPSLTDWDAQTNYISEGITDADGVAVFSNLDLSVYYLDVWEQNHDNYSLKSEDVGFVRTPEIVPHKINRFIAWVDYVVHTKGAAKGTRSVVIKKLERKPADKIQPESGLSSDDWQVLYNRRTGQK
jgi:PKD repeat protein